MVWDGTRWVRDTAAVRSPQDSSRTFRFRQPLRPRRALGLVVASIMVGSLVGFLMPSEPSAAASPQLILDPGVADAGSSVRLRLDNLPPKATFQLTWDGRADGLPTVQSTERGSVRARFVVPDSPPGDHVVAAFATGPQGLASSPIASTLFSVVVLAPALPTDTPGFGPSVVPVPVAGGQGDPTAAPTAPPTAKPKPNPTPRPAPRPPPPPPSGSGYWSVPFLARTPSGPISISNRSNVVITGKEFVNLGANVSAIRITNSHNVVIRANDFLNVSQAITVYDSTDVVIEWNRYQNIYGPHQRVGVNRGNFTQWVNTRGGAIRHNKGVGGDTEDVVSIYQSGGHSASSPLRIEDNQFEGTNWSSGSGSGMMLGDAGGSYITVQRNILVSPGQVGIGVPGGSNIRILNNTIYGARRSNSNVGIYVWNQSSGGCGGIEVAGNRVLWYRADGVENGAWNGGGCGTVSGWSSNDWSAPLNPALLHVRL